MPNAEKPPNPDRPSSGDDLGHLGTPVSALALQVATSFCFDSGAGPPILYPCHEPKALRKQRFQIVDPQPALDRVWGWVLLTQDGLIITFCNKALKTLAP